MTVGEHYLVDLVLSEILDSKLDLIVLVLGHLAGEIERAMETDINHPKLRIVENKDYMDGISTSIVAGLSEVEEEYDHVMIILADMPHIKPGIINFLIHQTFASGLPLAAIQIKGRRSHPVVIGRPFYDDVHQLLGDEGARDLFRRYPEKVCLVEPEEEYNDADIDTPEDFRALQIMIK